MTVAAVDGIASFPGLSIDSAGTGYSLVASSAGLASATSGVFAVRRAAVALAFRTQPTSGEAGLPFLAQPVVELRDSATGALLTDRRDSVTLTLASNTAGGELLGTRRVAAASGVAAFSDLAISAPGSGYVLTASAAGAVPAASTPLTVALAPTVLTVVTGDGQAGEPGAALPLPVRVRLTRQQSGAPLAGQPVGFEPRGGGRVGALSVLTDRNGEATTTWSVGTAGEQLLLVTHPGTSSAILTLRAAFTGSILTLSQLTAGDAFFCGVSTAAAVCWGNASSGQLGNGPAVNPGGLRNRPVVVSGERLVAVSAGGNTACGLTSDGRARCWGANGNGQLGNGTAGAAAPAPTDVVGTLAAFTRLAVGATHVCGNQVGVSRCWGSNRLGEVGNGAGGTPQSVNETRPVPIAGNAAFAEIASGTEFSCGVTTAGVLACWGRNTSGQLGDGTTISRNAPVPVRAPAGVSFRAVATGPSHSCALDLDNRLFCWGDNSAGQLGDGTSVVRSTPTPVATTLRFRAVTTGERHTCAIAVDDQAFCWGGNASGALGDGTRTDRLLPSAPVSGSRRWSAVAAASQTTCGIEVLTQRAFCWGSAGSGALGNGGEAAGRVLQPQLVLSAAP